MEYVATIYFSISGDQDAQDAVTDSIRALLNNTLPYMVDNVEVNMGMNL